MKLKNIIYSFITIGIVACQNNNKLTQSKEKEENWVNDSAFIVKGNYLVTVSGCNDCHSPKKMGEFGPEPDLDLMLSGHPSNTPTMSFNESELKDWVLFNHDLTVAVGPWGVTYAANITSDQTGIGNWSFSQFKKAITEGKYKGLENSRPLMPPMPWQNFKHFSEEDLKSIFAYLKHTKPVRNVVPEYKLPNKINKS